MVSNFIKNASKALFGAVFAVATISISWSNMAFAATMPEPNEKGNCGAEQTEYVFTAPIHNSNGKTHIVVNGKVAGNGKLTDEGEVFSWNVEGSDGSIDTKYICVDSEDEPATWTIHFCTQANNENKCFDGEYTFEPVEPKMCEIEGKEDLLAEDEGCKEDTIEMCDVAGKEELLASDDDCREDETPEMCAVEGKESLLASDEGCEEDEEPEMCVIEGKESLLAEDENCREDEEPTCEELGTCGKGEEEEEEPEIKTPTTGYFAPVEVLADPVAQSHDFLSNLGFVGAASAGGVAIFAKRRSQK
jgi:hypothetical protein